MEGIFFFGDFLQIKHAVPLQSNHDNRFTIVYRRFGS